MASRAASSPNFLQPGRGQRGSRRTHEALNEERLIRRLGATRQELDCEPPRVCRRPQLLRGWGHGSEEDTNKFSAEVRERAVRMVFDIEGEHRSQWAAIGSIAAKIGCTGETLRNWVRQAERDAGNAPVSPTDERARLRRWSGRTASLGRPMRSYARLRRILPRRSSTAGRSMIAFIDDTARAYGVEPICKMLPIAPSSYHAHEAQRRDPAQAVGASRRDAALCDEDPARLRGELPGLRRAQGVAAIEPGRRKRRALHRGATDGPWACGASVRGKRSKRR